MKKGLKNYSELSDNPFLEGKEASDISNIILNLSKAALELMYYIFDTNSFTEDRFIFDIDEFKKFANKKSDTSAIQSLRELCFVGIIAKTKISRVYWVNKNVFLDNKAIGYLKDLLNSKRKNKQK